LDTLLPAGIQSPEMYSNIKLEYAGYFENYNEPSNSMKSKELLTT
jgi:hypothetical protein